MYSYYGDIDEGFRIGEMLCLPSLPFPILILTPI